jgi:uncharacterized protein (TIGR03435 family)
MRRSPLSILVLALGLAGPVALAQEVMPSSGPAPAAAIVAPAFDVISVKPNKDSNGTRMQFTPNGLHGIGVTVRFLLYEGYGGINSNQVIGEPPWSSTDGFDIEAKVAPADVATLGKMNFEQRRAMFQSILADRFKLVVHHETRELPMYVLTVAKGGPKFKESAPDDPASTTPRRRGMMMNRGKVTATDAQVSVFVTILSRQLGRTIVDKTGLTGNYDFTLEWAPDDGGPPPQKPQDGSTTSAANAPDPGASVFTAIQEQLGLKLEATKGPVDVVVIDHIEKPTEN